jgi:hypothetical protein
MQAFQVMIAILLKHKFCRVYEFCPGGWFRKLGFILEAMTFVYMPDLYGTLKRYRIPVDIYASSWFVTMFATELSFDIIPTIIDLYFQAGFRTLVQVALALLAIVKQRLLQMSAEELMHMMSSSQTREKIFT